jgi:hypothetical protein
MVSFCPDGRRSSSLVQINLPVTPSCGREPGCMIPARFPTIVACRWRTSSVLCSGGSNTTLKYCSGVESGENNCSGPKFACLVQPAGTFTVSGPSVSGPACAESRLAPAVSRQKRRSVGRRFPVAMASPNSVFSKRGLAADFIWLSEEKPASSARLLPAMPNCQRSPKVSAAL